MRTGISVAHAVQRARAKSSSLHFNPQPNTHEPLGQSTQARWPDFDWNVPGGQLWQEPGEPYLPAAQGLFAVHLAALGGDELPAGQAGQLLLPVWGW